MAVLQCKMCGGSLIPVDATVCECDSCGTRQTIPNAGDDKKTNLFNRANRLRMNSEFDKAAAIYEQIVAEYPQEAEAFWGLCLCNYGIEYVDDPATGAKMPTCHRTLPTSIMEDSNFEQACDYADTIARKVYRDEAKAIDRIQKDILSIVANEAPYDVFICYKETTEDGSRTEDSVLAQDIYDALTAKGMKVFFSRITLEDKLGVQYEPYIYAALSSAKVMLAIGTAFEYYDAVWVKNEWSRFLGMMKTDKTKTLIPCFKGLDAYDMPKEFKGLQAQDMGKLGWQQDLIRGVEKLCGKAEQPVVQQTVVQQVVVQPIMNADGLTVDNAIIHAKQQLAIPNWGKAIEYAKKALDMDPFCARAEMVLFMANEKIMAEEKIVELSYDPADNMLFQQALEYAKGEEKEKYEGYLKTIRERFAKEGAQRNDRYPRWKAAMEQSQKYRKALEGKFVTSLSNFAAVLEDGTVYASSLTNKWNVSSWTGIDTLACNSEILAGLKADGTVVVTGDVSAPPDGVRYDTYTYDVSDWTDIVSISADTWGLFGIKSSGKVVWTGEHIATENATFSHKTYSQSTRAAFFPALASLHLPSAAVMTDYNGFLTETGDLYLPQYGKVAQHVKQCSKSYFLRDDGNVFSWHEKKQYGLKSIETKEVPLLTSGAALYDGYAIMDGGDVVKMEKSFDIKNNKMVLRVLAEDALWVCDYELGAICGAHSDGSFFAYYGTQKAAGVEWAKDWTDIVGIVKDSWNLVAIKKDGTMLCHGKEGKQFNLSGVRLFEDIDSFIENHDARIAKLKDEEKAHKRAAIEKVIEQKKAELASLKGLFTGARRKQLEAEIAGLNNKLRRI